MFGEFVLAFSQITRECAKVMFVVLFDALILPFQLAFKSLGFIYLYFILGVSST